MKSSLLLLGFAVLVLTSCSTAYRSGQTPDDVYFSPARDRDAYVQAEKQSNNSNYRNYDDDYTSSDDRWLRMRVRNRARWSAFDDYELNSYRYNNWNMHNPYSYSYNNYFNNYWSWNSWYNPYCPRVVVVSPKTNPTAYNKVRNFSLNSYTNNNYNNTRTTNVKPTNRVILRPSYNSNTNSNTNSQRANSGSLGTSIRKVFSNQGNDNYSNSNSSGRSGRTYTPSSSNNNSSNSSPRSSSSSSGSSGSSSGGGVSRPTRGGN